MPEWTHWLALATAALVVVWGAVGFWRGLSLKPTDPKTRPQSHAGSLLGMPWW
jgi:hypothetical protein